MTKATQPRPKPCPKCRKNTRARAYDREGRARWLRPWCETCLRGGSGRSGRARAKARMVAFKRGKPCGRCGFVAEHPCQIDVDHRDGDRRNNDSANLDVLCANCHRIKTFRNREHLRPKYA